MSRKNVLIVAVDGLRASALGAYGNTTYLTTTLDAFAAESLLLDACFAPAADLSAIYRALWQSLHPLRPDSAGDATWQLPRQFAERGFLTTLVTDDATVLGMPGGTDFQRAIKSTPTMTDAFAIVGDFVATSRSQNTEPQLVWFHTRGLYGPWLAPLEFQQSLLDEGDPPPVEGVEPPDFAISDDDDPDTAFRYGCAYAAQVMLLDDCWRGLMNAIDDAGTANEWLVALIGIRGFPLGEHGRIGGVDPRLHVEQLHVPLLMRFPDGRGRLSRRSELTTHLDLLPTLVEWEQGKMPPGDLRFSDGRSLLPLVERLNSSWRDALLSSSTAAVALRTPEWTLRKDSSSIELYVRPDDRWEANDVAARCPDVVAALTERLAQAPDDRPLPAAPLLSPNPPTNA